ncbi:nucleophosmin [Tachypleus tridentatus]|uniref:nucleophosmin n=1 Tax=Tachypleus tridentatus TaxID=6853 RepID=UPI003FCF524A
MSKEYLWVGKLDKNTKVVVFNPLEEGETDAIISHSLLVKKVLLGPCKDSQELNVIEIETEGYLDDEIKTTLCCLQSTDDKKFDQCSVDLLVTHNEAKFTLVEGSGPITIFGQHLAEYLEDEIISENGDEEAEEEQVSLELTGKKRKGKKTGGLPKKIAKMEVSHEEEDNEDEDEDEDEEEQVTPEKLKKKGGSIKKEKMDISAMKEKEKDGKVSKKKEKMRKKL